ncbi:methylaspartate mutase [Chitinophaga vietnamensis]|uniref:methylaspartate mutase n=1 Tax=Chitinophaga vietnamensis TaxID=2593957 RepID=UPI001177F170|nr:methylaspartate mutase [Chitinophaga vietnamensis]
MQQSTAYFHQYVKEHARQQQLVVQPRMGFSDRSKMRFGLSEVKRLDAPTIGTITLDSFTRSGDFHSAARAVAEGMQLNGYPIVSYPREENMQLIEGLREPGFPVQIRHGSPLPVEIFKATINAGIDAIEGGPISYCFPYGRIPLARSMEAWRTCCQLFGAASDDPWHIESFGGCMMGQLCPPAILIAITIAEAIFMIRNGVKSYSLSLAQGTHTSQDVAALHALRQLGLKYLGPQSDWHIVFYTFMGKFPQSYHGARALIEESARAAVKGGAERLIVKTVKEAHQIPLIEDNLNSLAWCHQAATAERQRSGLPEGVAAWTAQIYEEADFLIDLLLNLDSDLEKSMAKAFKRGYWDVPYCLHPDNRRLTGAQLDEAGFIYWSDPGKMPFTGHIRNNAVRRKKQLSSGELLHMLSFNQQKYDGLYIPEEQLSTP